jgi:hypothetical protein
VGQLYQVMVIGFLLVVVLHLRMSNSVQTTGTHGIGWV